jgi:hypothetical protein
MSEVSCPRCGKSVASLQTVDASLSSKLKEAGNVESIPSQVCASCFDQLAGGIARGSVLLAREKAREQKKLMLWKSRVNLIKKARGHMNDKMFSDAAVAYEKYLKVLEIVFDVEPGDLNPEHFKDSARTQELTVVASCYWDLLRIYDTSEKYGDRQQQAAKKLAMFLRFTPIFPDILRKAEIFAKTAKNPQVIKQFLKLAQDNKGKCFIATAAFDDTHNCEVVFLRNYRDQVLYKSKSGKAFVQFYYAVSPQLATLLNMLPQLKPLVKLIIFRINSYLASRQ